MTVFPDYYHSSNLLIVNDKLITRVKAWISLIGLVYFDAQLTLASVYLVFEFRKKYLFSRGSFYCNAFLDELSYFALICFEKHLALNVRVCITICQNLLPE